jgi:hypothetical protein
MAGSPIPATGVAWDVTIPDNGQPHGNDYNEHRETKLAVGIRSDKEHVAYAGSSAGGEHKPGSARIYRGDYSSASAGDALPTTKPDGATALDANDAGMLAHDTDATYGPKYYEWNGTSWGGVDMIMSNIASATKDEDNMASDSASHVPTQQSTKAYVDAQIAATRVTESGATVFNTTLTAAQVFQDLDLSGTVGSTYSVVCLEVYGANVDVEIKTKGYGGTWAQHNRQGAGGFDFSGNQYGMATLMTNSAGVIQIAASNNTSTVTIKLIGYISKA